MGETGERHAELGQPLGETVGYQVRFEEIASYINPMSPAELRAYIRTEQALWKPVIEKIATFNPTPN